MIKKIMPKEIQQAMVVGIIIFIAVLVWGGRFMYGKTLIKLLDYRTKRQRVMLENKVGNKLSELQKIRKDMTTIQESSRFLAEVAKISGQLNLKLKSISALPMEKRTEYIKLGVNLAVDTSFHELGLFVSRLETSEIFISIDKLVLSPEFDKDKPGVPRIIANMNVSTLSITDTILEK